MNKKFSTLVASLLFASAFSAFAGTAAPMVTETTTSVSTRALAADGSITFTPATAAALPSAVAGQLNGFTENSRLSVWKLDGTNSEGVDPATGFINTTGLPVAYPGAAPFDAFYFKHANGQLIGQDGIVLSIAATGTSGAVTAQKFDVVKVRDGKDAAATKPLTSFFLLREKTTGEYLTLDAAGTAWTLVSEGDAEIGKASLFASVAAAATEAVDGTDLNAQLKGGFNLSIAFPGVKDASIKGAELFAGKLTAIDPANLANEATGTSYYLKNKDGKFIVFDATIKNGNVEGGFKLQAAADVSTSNNAATFTIKVADNDPSVVEVVVDTDKRLYINRTIGATTAYSLTAIDVVPAGQPENWAVTSMGVSNTIDFKTLLTGKFVKINYVKNGNENNTNAYKLNGILGLRDNAGTVEADFVKIADVVTEDPATMWAPSIDGANLLLTNRENTDVKVSLASLREGRTGVYEATVATATGIADNDSITISFVDKTTNTDGYLVYADQVLKNSTFYLGQSRRNADGDVPAYWAENHGTHQIGATVNQEEATQWNVELIKKTAADYNTQIDSVLVDSKLYSYNATTGVTTETKSTLAVLPYVFQNRENREYVKLNNEVNLQYYICDKDNKNDSRKAGIQFFALKKKPGNTYNYVTLALNNTYTNGNVVSVAAVNGANKVYLKNSASKGTWEDVALYSDDANSLMIVDPIDAPEYRKVAAAWGDTVRIYRQEYPTEVLFEKADAKSVVDGKTLSFLNINNSVTGANPALFVDTAYVNRTVNGVDNTCYQYLLAVNVDKNNSYYCPYNPLHNTQEWRDEHNGGKPCADAMENAAVKGRFLINLIDTAYAYKQDHLHNNPYINMVEADENLAKLSFVEGIHANDTLYITRKGGEVVKLGMTDPAFNVAKFAFRYVDNNAGSFKIQTQSKNYNAADLDAFNESAHNEGYLRWVNGTVVVTNSYTNGEVFNMEENFKGNPVANEDITTSSVKVTTTEGKVIIAGAQGKKVTISNVLGQTVANAVLSSDKAEISAPAGVVIVAVEGEAAVKAIVK